MNQVIIYKQDNGTVAIIRPTEEALTTLSIEAIAKKDVPAGVEYKIIDASAIPTDRSFRNAWELNIGDVEVSHTKAQGITKDRLRQERAPLLTALDVQYQRAQEDGRDTTIIISEK